MQFETKKVGVRDKSFDSVGITKDKEEAICEYIWNGFEAGATLVEVKQIGAALQDSMAIMIVDNGCGIRYDNLDDTFGAFLASSKASQGIRIKSQENKGKGRFSYTSFTASAKWSTVFDDNGIHKKYIIELSIDNRENYRCTPVEITEDACGSIVELPLINSKDVALFSHKKMHPKLLEEFAWYLYLNQDRNVELRYSGVSLNYKEHIDDKLSVSHLLEIEEQKFQLDIVVWKGKTENASKIYYMADDGQLVRTENTSFNNNTVGFFHAAFVSSPYFSGNSVLQAEDEVTLLEEEEGQKKILRELRKQIRKHIEIVRQKFLIRNADERFIEMEEHGSYPKFSSDEYGQLRRKDFERVSKELYCTEPRIFYKLQPIQEKSLLEMLNLLLESDERENLLTIIEGIVGLSTEQRAKFADILKKSKLEHVIDIIALIQDRFSVVEQLKKMVYDNAAFFNERDHIQKMVEQHYWLFGEQYRLLTADRTIRTTLEAYEEALKLAGTDELSLDEKAQIKRMDVFLYSSKMTETGEKECVVVELKAPQVNLSLKVYNQIEGYAYDVIGERRFQSKDRVWRFIAVGGSVTDEVKKKYPNFAQFGRKCLAGKIDNFEIYAMSWDDVFTSFELRHRYLLEKLQKDYQQAIANKEDELDAEEYKILEGKIRETLRVVGQ